MTDQRRLARPTPNRTEQDAHDRLWFNSGWEACRREVLAVARHQGEEEAIEWACRHPAERARWESADADGRCVVSKCTCGLTDELKHRPNPTCPVPGHQDDAEDAVAPSPLALHRERLIETMIQHQRTDIRLCGCGWDQLGDRNVGRSHAVHIADAVLATATTGVLALHRARIFEVLDQHFDDPPGRDWLPVVDAVLATAVDLEPVVAEITKVRQQYVHDRLSERLEVQHGTASSHDVQVWTDAARRTWNNRYPALRDLAGGER